MFLTVGGAWKMKSPADQTKKGGGGELKKGVLRRVSEKATSERGLGKGRIRMLGKTKKQPRKGKYHPGRKEHAMVEGSSGGGRGGRWKEGDG